MKREVAQKGIRVLRSGRRSSSGFTLIELLMVLTLLGMVSLALFGGLRFGARAWEAAQSHSQSLSDIEIVQNLLRRQVSEIVQPEPNPDRRNSPKGPPRFSGKAENVSFTTYFPNHRRVGGLNFFRINLTEAENGMALKLSWRLYNADGSEYLNGEGRETRILLDGLQSAVFSYYGRGPEDREAIWHEEWPKGEDLPQLIRLNLTFLEDDSRYWPELMIAPRAPSAR
ncbi:MAG: prepilin-type N-terminal cleavage/methylation domain-containing protein [Pseudomonadota bacterium]